MLKSSNSLRTAPWATGFGWTNQRKRGGLRSAGNTSPVSTSEPQMSGIPEYFLARKRDWRTKDLKPTDNWDEATLLWDAGEYVRIVKPGDSYDRLQQFIKEQS